MSKYRIDMAWFAAAALAVGLFSLWLYFYAGHMVVEQGPYYGSDIDRVRENLLHPDSAHRSYKRMSVHPLYGLICVAAQLVQRITHLSDSGIFALMAFVYGALAGGLTYVAARLWSASAGLAAAIVVFSASTAGFVYWGSITETHSWGGLTLLMVIAMARLVPVDPDRRLFWHALTFAVSFSILVTHAMMWLFSRLPLDSASLSQGWTKLRKERLPLRIGIEIMAGLGLVLLGYTAARLGLGVPLGPLLEFQNEGRFIPRNAMYPLNGFNIFGLVGPRLDYGLSLGVFVNALFGLACCATIFVLPPRLRFAAAFLIFALLLHSNFVRYQSFLFASEYTPAAVILLGLAIGKRAGRWAVPALLICAVPLAIVNVTGFHDAAVNAATGQGSMHPNAVNASSGIRGSRAPSPADGPAARPSPSPPAAVR